MNRHSVMLAVLTSAVLVTVSAVVMADEPWNVPGEEILFKDQKTNEMPPGLQTPEPRLMKPVTPEAKAAKLQPQLFDKESYELSVEPPTSEGDTLRVEEIRLWIDWFSGNIKMGPEDAPKGFRLALDASGDLKIVDGILQGYGRGVVVGMLWSPDNPKPVWIDRAKFNIHVKIK